MSDREDDGVKPRNSVDEPTPMDPNESAESAGAQGGGGSTSPAAPASRLLSWVLPPVLAMGAVGAHFALNVPDEPVVHNKRDQAAARARRRAARARKRRQARMFDPRPGSELDTLLERYEDTDFDDEPIVGKWARQTQTMLNKAIVLSRKSAFEGAPEPPRVSVVRTQCRTIRCRIVLRSPYPHELDLMVDAVRRMETIAGENIWRRFSAAPTDAPARPRPPRPRSPTKASADSGPAESMDRPEDRYVQITGVLIADNIESDELAVGEPEAD